MISLKSLFFNYRTTVAVELSVIRSLFNYLRVGGFVGNNPALTKLVPSPKPAEDLRGRALTVKEAGHILAGPDREKSEGPRDYAILLTLLRTSLRVGELCSLKTSSVKWSHGHFFFGAKSNNHCGVWIIFEVRKSKFFNSMINKLTVIFIPNRPGSN